MGDRPPPSGPLIEGALYLLGEDVLEKLKMLGYEAEFVDEKGYRPFSCVEFVTERKSGLVGMPTAVCNTAPQWGIFEELVEWLMAKCGSTFMKDQYDDPNTIVNKIMVELKNMEFQVDFSPQKLKLAYGDAVLQTLNFLCERALKKEGFVWGVPVFPNEAAADEAEVDEVADTAVDNEEEVGEDIIEEEEVMYSAGTSKAAGAAGKKKEEDELALTADAGVLEADIDPIEWKTELERVGPRLRQVDAKMTSGNEWYTRLGQTKLNESTIKQLLPSTEKQLKAIAGEMSDTIERVSKQEQVLTAQFEHLGGDFKVLQTKHTDLDKQYQTMNATVGKLTGDLNGLTEKLGEVKASMEKQGNSMTDTSPLVKIKGAVQTLNEECAEMEMQIGVVSHGLNNAKLRNKRTHEGRLEAQARKKKDAEEGGFGDDAEVDFE